MPDKLAALRHLLAASRYGATDHRATIPLKFLDARAVAGWLYWKLSQRQLGEIEPGDVRRIKVLSDQNALLLVGESAALDRLDALIDSLDVPSATGISLTCISVETGEPQRLLSQPRTPTIVEMPDGSQLDPATEELDVGRLGPVAPDFADECMMVVNPYVDTAELDEMIEEGVAEMPWEPRFAERQGLGGAVTYQCEHTMPSGQAGLRMAALLGQNGLITVQVSLRCDGDTTGATSATVQYVAFPGQTVAVGVMPRIGRVEKMTVLLVTADTIDRRARGRAHQIAQRHTRGLRRTPAPHGS